MKLIIDIIVAIGNLIINVLSAVLFFVLRVFRITNTGIKNRIKKFNLRDFLTQDVSIDLPEPATRMKNVLSKPVDFSFIKNPFSKKTIKYEDRKKRAYTPKYNEVKDTRVKGKKRHGFRMFVFGVVFATIFVFIPSHILLWLGELPNPELLITKDIPTPSKILDRDGRLLFEIFIDKRYEPVKLNLIPDHVVNATIGVEDDQFYSHHGFDLQGMMRATRAIVLDDELQGGSTITQQLVKNVLLTPERTISRKVKELILSIAVDAKYSKDQILEMYLNNISYGGTAWGIQSASQKFFAKNVWELDLAEASLLAGLPSSPTTYSPLAGDTTLAKDRQEYVLERMYQLGYITRQEADQAYSQQLEFAPQTEYIRAPHFVAYVRDELEKTYGKRLVELGGLTIKTTLDLDLQDKVQTIVTDEVAANAGLLISNGAAVVLDAHDRGILAYVGSVDYFKEGWGAYDVASAYRQPGSSIKPLTYALALENGYTPATPINDKPITYKFPGQKPYTPKNYDGQYHGNVTLRAALANSYNIPAVKLAHSLGPDNIVQKGKEFGLSNWEVDGSYGLSVTLGGKEVRLLDHANFFASLARGGSYKDSTPFISIKDRNGFEMYDSNKPERQVLSKETAYLVWHILSDNNARVPAFGSRSSLVIPGKKVAVKTGTTDNIRDNFTMGYTPSYVVGVWVGNNDNRPLSRFLASGLSGAAPIWNRIMSTVLENVEDEQMERPANIFAKYDAACGRSEVFTKGSNIPQNLCPEQDDEDKDKDKDKDDDE